ncbi:Hypothetical predicted protein [Marmota monax]|uniref:Uncharacterized protein n=1 Tax=Marmota monax TaxID=9995 RepID=A0A5E4B281_MARMO|nr:hypothetical protein GHT09_011135 [Marmota monax]VTJ63186.1 Hypothetical predicted protein [Marmota monax]
MCCSQAQPPNSPLSVQDPSPTTARPILPPSLGSALLNILGWPLTPRSSSGSLGNRREGGGRMGGRGVQGILGECLSWTAPLSPPHPCSRSLESQPAMEPSGSCANCHQYQLCELGSECTCECRGCVDLS